MLYAKVSDLNSANNVPFNAIYGESQQKNLYKASTWDIYGMSDPSYVEGEYGNVYVPDLARGGMDALQHAGVYPYSAPANPSYPPKQRTAYIGHPPPGQPLGNPSLGGQPLGTPPRRRVENFEAGYPRSETSQAPSPPSPPPQATSTETPVDEIYTTTKKNYTLKNPLLVMIFLMAIYGSFYFLWSGIEKFLIAKFNGGDPLSWKAYLMYGLGLVALMLAVGYLFGVSFMKIEELDE